MIIDLNSDPIALYQQWAQDAAQHPGIAEPTAVALATASTEGWPSVRMVLIKEVSSAGFVFYTNLESQKSQELLANPRASFCQHWMPLERQIRVSGSVSQVSDAEADRYFDSRDRMSRIGAWASKQSRPIEGSWDLKKRVARYTARFVTHKLRRPAHWSGFRIKAEKIEFWVAKPFRLHERVLFRYQNGSWQSQRLFP